MGTLSAVGMRGCNGCSRSAAVFSSGQGPGGRRALSNPKNLKVDTARRATASSSHSRNRRRRDCVRQCTEDAQDCLTSFPHGFLLGWVGLRHECRKSMFWSFISQMNSFLAQLQAIQFSECQEQISAGRYRIGLRRPVRRSIFMIFQLLVLHLS